MKLCILLMLLIMHESTEHPSNQFRDITEKDGDESKKIIGSSVVTSVSVILNGNEPQFTDAVGKPIPKPKLPLQVASPINLLNPDRYEFYTFDDNGELVKRLMTLKEIQSIVANGDNEGAAIIHNVPIDDRDPGKNVQDIVQSVQNVLTKEVEGKRNNSNPQLILDTPDVSSSWSMILPAIFGNTGGDIFPQKPQQVVMTPDSDVVESSSQVPLLKPSTSSKPKPTKQKLSTKRRPTVTRKPVTSTISDFPQKIFVNNEEIMKPLFNRVDITTKVPSSNFDKFTTVQTQYVSSTRIKPTKYNAPISTAFQETSSTATLTSSSIPRTTTTTTTSKTAASTIAETVSTTVEQNNRDEFTTTTIVRPTITTTTKPLVQTSTLAQHQDSTVEVSSVKNNDSSLSTITSKYEEFTSPSEDDHSTTLNMNNMLESLSESHEDLNAKLSFDQILESLKDDSHTSDMSETLLEKKGTTALPVLTNGMVHQSSENNKPIPTTANVEYTTSNIVYSSEESDEFLTTTESPMETSVESLSKENSDEVHVVKYEPLFVELRDPVLTNLATEVPTTTTSEYMDEDFHTTQMVESDASKLAGIVGYSNNAIKNKTVEVKIINTTSSPNLVKKTSNLTQLVDSFITSNMNNFEEVSLSPQNVDVIMQKLSNGNISMSDFKQQVATAASLLEISQITPSTPHTEVEQSDEIQSLLSDVMNQMTDTPSASKTEVLQQEETSNRLSNVAHINADLFQNSQNTVQQLEIESEKNYEKLDTIAPHSENTGNKNQIVSLSASNSLPNKMSEDTEKNKNNAQHKPVGYSPAESTLLNKEASATTLKVRATTPSRQENEYEMTTFTSGADEVATTEMPISNENQKNPPSFEHSKDEEDNTKMESDANPTTESNSYDEDPIENQTAESDFADSNDKFAEIATTFMYSKGNDRYEEQDLEEEATTLETMELSTTTPSAEDENFTMSDIEDASESVTNTMLDFDETKVTSIPDIFNLTETENVYVRLGESTEKNVERNSTNVFITTEQDSIAPAPSPSTPPTTRRPATLKPVHYFKQPSPNDHKLLQFNNQRPVHRPPSLTNLKVNQGNQPTRPPVKLEPTPEQTMGLEASTMDLQEDVQEFSRLCNELAFSYWKSITSEKISPARSLVLSPFALTSMLSMVFLGARGGTSGEMNEILKLDDMVTFNPHLVFKNITDSVEHAKDSSIASSAFVREIYSDRANGRILQFFKEKTQQLYSGHVEEVNFNVVNDIIRRRTNLLIKRHTFGKVMEYLRTNSVWVNGPLATVSANLFQTDCSKGSVYERDGEMFFQVHPSIRQRRLVPIPAAVFRTGFTAGYDPDLDATIVAFGSTYETVSTIYLMPGQQGLAAPGDNLERLERNLVDTAVVKNSWSRLLTSLMERPGLEVQLPRFSHRSFINASMGLQKMGLKTLFNADNADLRGLTGMAHKDVFLSDMIQINTFSTCAEDKITEHHHVEMYPAPPLRRRNAIIDDQLLEDPANIQADFTPTLTNDNARAFYDDLLNPKYLELPLPLRPRQARIPDAPRLRFDKPFLYYVRHNPTGMILFMGRFNPRLLP